MKSHLSLRNRGMGRVACLLALAVALLGCVLLQAERAESFALSKVEEPSSECGVCIAIGVPIVPASSAGAIGADLEGSGEKGGPDPGDLREAYELLEAEEVGKALSNLMPSTQYYLRIVTTNGNGTENAEGFGSGFGSGIALGHDENLWFTEGELTSTIGKMPTPCS